MMATALPAWAALSTSGLKAVDLPDAVRNVIILADGDDPGEAAACAAAQRWQRYGRRIRIARPPRGTDFNDVLLNNLPSHRGASHEKYVIGAPKNPAAALIDAAETVSNPLDRIVERAAIDRGAPFTPDILASLIRLRLEDRPAFETLRGQLKQAGCRVVELDKAIAKHQSRRDRRLCLWHVLRCAHHRSHACRSRSKRIEFSPRSDAEGIRCPSCRHARTFDEAGPKVPRPPIYWVRQASLCSRDAGNTGSPHHPRL